MYHTPVYFKVLESWLRAALAAPAEDPGLVSHGSSPPFFTPVPGLPVPFSGIHGTAHTAHIRLPLHIHTHKIEQILETLFQNDNSYKTHYYILVLDKQVRGTYTLSHLSEISTKVFYISTC